MQVNTTLTELNLQRNNLGPEGGKAIAKSLQVTFPFLLSALYNNEIDFLCFPLTGR